MTETPFIFRLLLSNASVVDDYEIADALHGSGFDDVTFGVLAGTPYADVTRAGDDFGQTVLDTIAALEATTDQLRVVRVEPDELVTASRIAERTSRTRQSVNQLIAGDRGPGDFPSPVTFIDAQTRVWRWTDVRRWFAARQEEEPTGLPTPQQSEFLAALNGALDVREHLQRYRDNGGSGNVAGRVKLLATQSPSGQAASGRAITSFVDHLSNERQVPAEADALLSLGRRVADRVPNDTADQRCRWEHLVQALTAYDATIVLRAHYRDAAASVHNHFAFSSAAKLASLVTTPPRGNRALIRALIPRYESSVYCQPLFALNDDRRGGSDAPSCANPACAYLPVHRMSRNDIQGWLAKHRFQSESVAYWTLAYTALCKDRERETDRWLDRWTETLVEHDEAHTRLPHLSYAVTQAIASVGGHLLAADERHLLDEISRHVEQALTHGR